MFSIEEEFDASVITIVDNDAKYEDFQIIVSDDVVFLAVTTAAAASVGTFTVAAVEADEKIEFL